MKTLKFIVWFLIVFLLAGCGGSSESPEPTVVISPEASPTPLPEPTAIPTATALPSTVVLWAPPESDQALVESIQTAIMQSATDAGMRFQVQPTLSVDVIALENIRWVVALAPAPGLNDLVVTTPQVRYLALGVKGLTAAPNLSVIATGGESMDQQGFMAGYMSAAITPDWRVGVISIADSEAGQVARRSFLTGAKFFCGFCSPTYPPFHQYPLYVQLNVTASAAEWQAAADLLLQKNVETVFIVPGAGDENLLRYLANAGVNLIGGGTAPDDLTGFWVATLGHQPLQTFFEFWPDFVSGIDGQSISLPLSISNVNQHWISPGQLRLIEEMLEDVKSGYIQLVGENIP